jgi:hypothetical protein
MIKENRTSKYLLYAIGEIVLVVIGILIALSINNMNKKRIDNVEATEIKKALLNDLAKDTILIKKNISRLKNDLNYTIKLINRYRSKHANFDTLVNVAKDFNPRYSTIKSFNNTTYQSIISTGKIQLLENKIKTIIIKNNQLQTINLVQNNFKFYNDITLSYTSNYPIGKPIDIYVNNIAWKINNKRDFVVKLTIMCEFRRTMLKVSLKKSKETLESTKELIEVLNKNL